MKLSPEKVTRKILDLSDGSSGGGNNDKGLTNNLCLDGNELVEVHERGDKEMNMSEDKGKAIFGLHKYM
ncbi:predicted protein [Arabidopsis lyrata subsp. lyrata]|uniref:Predicted protein n=1 Tax=Arabidopsis lyrata subsp. lyrata TaxID=81972 RepID=D7LG35_ARALL|nr:predicted protein [Arabidopsis lyrata subsp. lyrata]